MTDAAPEPELEPLPADWPRGVKLPYLVDKVQDVPADFVPRDWREFADPHPELDPEELDRFMAMVENEE